MIWGALDRCGTERVGDDALRSLADGVEEPDRPRQATCDPE